MGRDGRVKKVIMGGKRGGAWMFSMHIAGNIQRIIRASV